MHRALFVAVVAVGAGCSSSPTCLLPDVIAEQVGNQELDDCGTAEPTAPIADVQAIHDCVIADQAAMTPFRAVEHVAGTTKPAVAYLGVTEGGMWKELLIEAGDQDQNPYTATFECPTGLSEITPCDDATLRMTLCLRCDVRAGVGGCPTTE